MDPLSITGFVLAIGQSIGPIVNGIRALRKYKEIEASLKASLERSELYCMRLEAWLEAISDIDEATVSPVQLVVLQHELNGFQIAVASHAVEVRNWLQALGIPDNKSLTEAATLGWESGSETSVVKSDISEMGSPTKDARSSSRRKVFSRLSRLVCFGRYSLGENEKPEFEQLKEKASIESHSGPSKSPTTFTSVARKTQFIILGEHVLNNLASQLACWDDRLLTSWMRTMSSILSKTSMKKNVLKSLHPATRFITEARERVASGGDLTVIAPDIWHKYYERNLNYGHLDENVRRADTTKQVPLMFGNFVPECSDVGDEKGRKLESYRSCIFIDRGLMDDAQEEASLKLGALFSGGHGDVEVSDKLREDGDMLRCVAMTTFRSKCILLFKLPPGSSPRPLTLRCALDPQKNPGGFALHPISDRVKLATRLTTALFVLHSLGYVHKRINPERIILVESASGGSAESFPRRLGYPYLVAFNLSREDLEPTTLGTHFYEASIRGIYFHFRDQAIERQHEYNMRDDIYSLGVCLFEIALWRSLFVWKGRDYVYDDSFVELSDGAKKFADLDGFDLGRARAEELIRVAEERIPGVLGHGFTKAVVACLKVQSIDSPYANHPRLEAIRSAPASRQVPSDKATQRIEQKKIQQMECLTYLELVLHQLQAVYRGLQDVEV